MVERTFCRGPESTSEYYYSLSALTFDYEAAGGAEFALQCVINAYINGGGPFGGVVESIKGSEINFADPTTETAKWAAWCDRA
jgi:hypothetical protein